MESLLRAPTLRQRVLAFVLEHPGTTLGQLRRALSLSWGRAHHHVKLLERLGALQRVRAGRRALLMPAGLEEDERSLRARALLRGETARRVAQAVALSAPTDVEALSRALGESRRVVYYHVKQLIEAGVVQSASRTRHFGLVPSPSLRSLLAPGDVADDIANVLPP